MSTSPTRIVGLELQERFAALSGDRNPMHMDPVAARRTQAGLQVVHGVHTLLWALETLAAQGDLTLPPDTRLRVKAKFLKWVYLGDEAVLRFVSGEDDGPAALEVQVLGMPVLTAELLFSPVAAAEPPALPPSPAAPLSQAADLSFSDLRERAGEAYTAPAAGAEAMFPLLGQRLGGTAVSELAACSYIVGMEAPGLHSMFSKLDVTLSPDAGPVARTALPWRVSYTDERFRKLRIAVAGRAVEGTLEVFLRVPPVRQAEMAAVAERVAAGPGTGAFAGMRALVVGGSRGLGELTAKIIAAGGGQVTLTYALGRTEAETLAGEIRAFGTQADVLAYNVRSQPGPQLAGVSEPFTHMLYFATNAIFRPKGSLVSPPILAEFSAFYLQGFYDLCVELLRGRPVESAPMGVYYPSSSALDLRPEGMTEYSMIKAAGEVMCQDMNQYLPGLRILTTRLPRLPTDQTAGVLPGKDLAPIDVMLPIIEDLIKLTQGSTS